jgi:phage terminase large subunit
MSIAFHAFDKQKAFLNDTCRIRGAFAGKRGGKTEVGAIAAIELQQNKPNHVDKGIDPYLGAIIAPTSDMLRRLSLKKFKAYAHPFIKSHHQTTHEIKWWDDSEIYGLSASKPERIEGIKANWIWLDEVFQMSENLFLECRARLADTQGFLICTGSLGQQFVNPKLHWAYKYFKENPGDITSCHEWSTSDNPYFPKEELEDLKNTLDPETYRMMFTINWDSTPKTAVYHQFNEANIIDNYSYNPALPTYVSIDWGWAHEMACGFFQYDEKTDRVYLFDEIVKSKMTVEELYNQIMARPYKISGWCCDIAGNQERELVGRSNVAWFRDRGVHMKSRRSAVNNGITLVRTYVRNMKDQSRFFIAANCRKSIDGMKQYRYPEKDGIIQNELPIKKDDDAVDMIRYFFMNYLDKSLMDTTPVMLKR